METLREMAKERHKTIGYKLSNVWYVICSVLDFHYHFKRIKWFIQRGKRGYSDCDWWSMYNYIIDISIPMLEKLRDNSHGHPTELSSSEEWSVILGKIIEGFKSGKKIANIDNWVINEDSEMYIDKDDYLQFTNNWTDEQIKEFKELDKKDNKTFKEGMKLFSKWFLNLWD